MEIKKTEEELLLEVESLKVEIKKLKKRKRFGLVWEDKPEKFDKESKNALPVLKEKGGKFNDINPDDEGDFNILIEGDNYHSLSVLNYTHRGKIDVIYIDPPYNTGNKDFIYNDKFIDKEDVFRHSKWLSFMSKRLKLAKNLLKDDGLIFMSIDDNEQAQLKLLCDQIFGEGNFIENIMVEMSNTGGMKVGSAKDGKIAKNGEFILLYSKSGAHKNARRTALYDYVSGFDTHFNLYINKNNQIEKLSNILAKNKDVVRELKHFGVSAQKGSVSIKKLSEFFDKSDVLQEFVLDNINKIVRPRDEVPNIPQSIQIEKGKITEYESGKREEPYLLTLDENNLVIQLVPMSFNYRNTDDFSPKYGRSVIRGDFWKGFWIDMGNISKEGSVVFKNGKKPIRLIKQLLKWSIFENKSAIVLDFMAGSGTTGHAVLELNKEDGGNRKFILNTNNENNICEEVTYERIKRVMSGCTTLKGDRSNGLGGKLKYLKTDFVPKQVDGKITDEDKIALTYETGLILALKENTFDEREKNDFYQIFDGVDKATAVYFRENKEKLNELLEKLEQSGVPTKLYIFSWDKGAYKGAFAEYKNISAEDIPEPILEVYKSIGL